MSQPTQSSIKHLSEKPWSDYTASDYTVEQWHSACLIHQHEGPPTSKNQCKLPVKTPNGAVNRNAVYSAAAALAGARGGVHASSSEKSSAATALIRYYRQMDEKPPPSLLNHSIIENFIEHYGTRGMKWGVRNTSSGARPKQSGESKKASELKRRKPHQLTNKQLKSVNERINLEQNFTRLNPSSIKKGKNAVAGLIATAGIGVAAYNLVKSPAGQAAIKAGKKVLENPALRTKVVKKSAQLTLPGI